MSTNNNVKIYCRDLESLLQKNFGDDLIVLRCTISNLVPEGENFRSEVLKITAQVRRTNISCTEDFHLVAKTLPFTIIDMVKNLDWTRLFKKEIFMYTKIVPFYKTIEKECIASTEKGVIADMFPKFYGYRLSLNSKAEKVDQDAVILLEDLKVQKYYVNDKQIGLDMAHATKAIEALARFHALGIIAKRKHPSRFELLKSAYPNPDFDSRKKDAFCAELLESIKNDAALQRFARSVEKLSTTQRGGWDPKVRTSDTWSTIVHYDFWTNNLLFLGDSSKRVKFVDFQTHCWADLFLDLAYFVGSSLSDEVGSGRLNELTDVYYGALVSALESAAVDVGAYSRRKFDERLKDLARYEFFHCAVVLNVITSDVDGGVADRKDTGVPLARRYKENSLFRWKIAQLCQIYESRGWFD